MGLQVQLAGDTGLHISNLLDADPGWEEKGEGAPGCRRGGLSRDGRFLS